MVQVLGSKFPTCFVYRQRANLAVMLVVKWALALVANPTVVVDCVRVKVADRVTVTYRFVVREKAVKPPRILVDVRVKVTNSPMLLHGSDQGLRGTWWLSWGMLSGSK